jgi:hypothetical protein
MTAMPSMSVSEGRRRAPQCSGSGLVLLAPAGDRERRYDCRCRVFGVRVHNTQAEFRAVATLAAIRGG